MKIVVDGEPVEVRAGETLLVALLRAGRHPTGGGCLCLGGDCPHCLVSVDGIAYVRSCQVTTRAGMKVERQHLDGAVPPLPPAAGGPSRNAVPARHVHCDVAVIGQGEAGRRAAAEARGAGKEVVTLDAAEGQEAVGIYSGPLVVARTAEGTLQVHVREEVIVATGAAEIHPVAPGSELQGLVTARAAEALAAAGIDLGRVVAIGEAPAGVDAVPVEGEIVRFEGEGRVRAVVVRDAGGSERRHECDTVSLGLGLHPRDALARMAHHPPPPVKSSPPSPTEGLQGEASPFAPEPGLQGEGSPFAPEPGLQGEGSPLAPKPSPLAPKLVGDAAREPDLPPCPRAGVVCPCSGVRVADLESVWERGFRELELVKRATLAGTGTCQGSVCVPHVRSFLRERGGELQPAFTARPVTRQLTLGEIASGACHPPTARTPLHDEHLELGARMERSGGWWRPWSYGDSTAEQRAVRDGVSIGDVSTLGKFEVSGPDATELLDRLYPTRVSTLKMGRSRYALLLDERGYVLDDGLICRDSETRYTLTLTSAGSTFGELWLRDWADAGGYDVRLMNRTTSLAAINVTGPRAPELLAAAGVAGLPGFARHGRGTVAGIDCRIYRLSFTGELSYELHHAAADAVALWRRLLEIGAPYGVRPHGLEALLNLRLEKGHLVVGQDTDYDSTPRRLHHEWAVKLGKDDFVGRQALLRTNRLELDRRLVGLEMRPPAPIEGAVVRLGDRWVGNVTSSAVSPVLDRAVMLAWLHLVDGELPEAVSVDGRPARRVPLPFYDPDGQRARARVEIETGPSAAPSSGGWNATGEPPSAGGRFHRLEATRIVAAPEALDAAAWPPDAVALRIAPDEVLVTGEVAAGAVADPHAIVERETGFSGAWLTAEEAADALARACAWEPPSERPAFAQGAVAEVPVKLWLEDHRSLWIVPTPYAHDLTEQLS